MAGIIFIAIGIFTITCAAKDWDWFMEHRKARMFVGLFGRKGARIFYCALGLAFLAIGLLAAAGVIETPKERNRRERPAETRSAGSESGGRQ